MEDNQQEADLSPQAVFIEAIEKNNKDIFYRHIGLKRKDRDHPIDMNQALIECCRCGRVDMLKNVMTFHPNVNYQDSEGKRAIHHAAISGNLEIVQLIVKTFSTINCYDSMSYCPIHWACEHGHADVVQYLLSKGANVTFSKISTTGEGPIHVACRAGHDNVVKVLIQGGADIHAKLNGRPVPCPSFSPLHIAVSNGKSNVVETLCSLGAQVNLKSSEGRVPLHMSALYGHAVCTKILLDFGADVAIRDNKGNTPLLNAVLEGHIEIVQLLLSWEPDIHRHNGETLSVMFAALSGPDYKIFNLVIDAGGDVDERKPDTLETVLMMAVGLGKVERVKLLLEHNANVNTPDRKSFTPLHRVPIIKAPDDIKAKLTECLIKAGARINAADTEGYTPLHRAIFTGIIFSKLSSRCIKILVEAGSRLWPGPALYDRKRQSPLCWLTWHSQFQTAEYLVRAGWDMSSEVWVNLRAPRPQQDKIHRLFQQIAYNTRSLKQCCRGQIRRYLSDVTCDREIQTTIQRLPIPNPVKSYLSLEDCDYKDITYFENM